MSLIKVTSPRVPSGECKRDTKRRRSDEICKIRGVLSMGDTKEQLESEMKCLPSEEQHAIMQKANFMITIPPQARSSNEG